MKLARFLTAVAFLVGGGCSAPPGPVARSEAIAEIARGSYTAPAAGGAQVSFLRAGEPGGRRVVFVHGTPGAADGWADYLLDVPAGYEYFAVDRPGFGATRPQRTEPSLAAQARALEPLLRSAGGKPPILVGHSLGGPIVAWAAADFPGQVGALLILAGSLDPGLEKIHPMQPVGEWWGVRSLLPRSLRNANRELLPLKSELAALAPKLDGIRLPVTLVHGTADTLVPVANVDFMRTRLTGAAPLTVRLLPNAGHFLPWEHRAEVEAALAELASR